MEKYCLTSGLKEFYMNNRFVMFFCFALVLFCGSARAMGDGPLLKKRKLSEKVSKDNNNLLSVLPCKVKKIIVEFYLKDLICRASCSCRIFKYYEYIGSVEEFIGMPQKILQSFIMKFDKNDIRATIFDSEREENLWMERSEIDSCWSKNPLVNQQKIKENLLMLAIRLHAGELVRHIANKENAFFDFENRYFNLSSLTSNCSDDYGAGQIYVKDYNLNVDVSSLFTFIIDYGTQDLLQFLIQHGSEQELSHALWYAVAKNDVGAVFQLLNCDDVELDTSFKFYDEDTNEDKTIYVNIVERAQKLLFNEFTESYFSTVEWEEDEVVSESASEIESESELEEYFE